MNSLKSLVRNWGPLSEMIRGRWSGNVAGPLDDRLDLGFGHALAELPVNNEPAVAIEEAAEVVERAGDVDVGDIDVPVFVGTQGLLKALALFSRVCDCEP